MRCPILYYQKDADPAGLFSYCALRQHALQPLLNKNNFMPKQLLLQLNNQIRAVDMSASKEKCKFDDEDSIKCTHQGYGIKYARKLYRGGAPSEYLEYQCIHDAILDTRLFCMEHAQAHAENLCRNAHISVPS